MNSGRYKNSSEVVCERLRMRQDQYARAKFQREELRAAIAAGVASGPGRSADAVFDRLFAKYRKQIGKREA